MDLDQWLAYQQTLHPRGIDLGLDRVRTVAQRLGLTRPAPRVVTVGGTNGKGSVVAMLEAILRAADRRVGAYTSPHLLRYNERLRLQGEPVADADWVAAFEAVEAARGPTTLSFFEFGTLAALWLMQRAQLDVALLEVGLGGRLDAVNIVDADVAVVTTIGLDHQDYLGPDLDSIGAEKAGIARAGRPLVIGDPEAPPGLLRAAQAIGARILLAGRDFGAERLEPGRWRCRCADGAAIELPLPALDAPAQLRNAAAVVQALRLLDPALSDRTLARGLREVRLAGRLQRWPGPPETVLDVAHNPQAAAQLAAWLDGQRSARTLAVFSALGDKDIGGIARALGARVDAWFLAGLPDQPRGLAVDTLAERMRGALPQAKLHRCATVADALATARAAAQASDRVLVFGSFHTVADALTALQASAS